VYYPPINPANRSILGFLELRTLNQVDVGNWYGGYKL